MQLESSKFSKLIEPPPARSNQFLSDQKNLIDKELIAGKKSKPKSNSLVVGHLKREREKIVLPQEKVLQHVAIIGCNGSGQIQNFFYPNLIDLKIGFVFIDQGLYGCELLSSVGKKVLLYDPNNLLTEQFNWIPLCKDNIEWAYLLAEASLIERAEGAKSFHQKGMVSFLVSIYSHTATLDDPTPLESYNLIFNNDASNLLSVLSLSSSTVAKKIAITLETLNVKVLEGYLEQIRKCLNWLANPNIVFFTDTTSAPDFSRLRKEKIGVYINAPDSFYQIPALHRIILTVIVNQLKANEGSPVYLFLSHIVSIGYLSCMEELNSLTQHKIGLIVSLHTSTMVWENCYGEETAKKMLDSCYCKVVVGVGSLVGSRKTLAKASELIENDGRSYSFKVDLLAREHLLFLGDKPPVVVGTIRGWKYVEEKLGKSDSWIIELTCNLLIELLVNLLLIGYTFYCLLYWLGETICLKIAQIKKLKMLLQR